MIEEEIRNQLARMSGWCSPEKALALYKLVAENKPAIAVDVGVFSGKSCLSMAYGMRDNGSGIVIGVDAWEKNLCTFDADEGTRQWWSSNVDLGAVYKEFLGHLLSTNLTEQVRILRMSSWSASRVVDDEIGILHLDGSHDELSSSSDVAYWLPKLAVGGHIILDDHDWASLAIAVKLTKKCCDEVEVINSSESHSMVLRKTKHAF